jgi:predicted anti-sigma-YlaC factor YlaD
VECDRAREAISARIDGEDSGVPGGALEAHLAGCAACRGWQQRAHAVTRRARLGGSFLDRDLAPRVLAAIPAADAGRRVRLPRRAGLMAVALAQLAITVPPLILGHDPGAGGHAAHELGSFDVALAIAFAVGAIRPALSAGLAWPCGIAAAGLAATAIADVIGGQAIGADEARHLVAVFGAVLLYWQARTRGAGSAGPAWAAARAWAGTRSGAGPEPGFWLDGPPDSHGGGMDAARAGRAGRAGRDGRAARDGRAGRAGPARRGQDGDGGEAVA